MNTLIPVNDILSLINDEVGNYKLTQIIRYRDDMYEYKFSFDGENLSKDFKCTLDKESLKKQLNVIASIENDNSLEKIETITKNFNLDDLNEKVCRS